MDKIAIKVTPPNSLKEYEQKQYEVLCKNDFLQQYLKNNGMDESDLRNYLPLFVLMVKDLKECQGCGGLSNCPKSEKGYQSVLKKGRFVDVAKKACPYMEREKEFRKIEKMYLYKPFTKQQMAITFDTMKLFTDDAVYMSVFDKVADYLVNPQGKGLYLYGDVGVGKTYLMMALCNEFVKQGKSVAFVNVSEFLFDNKIKINYALIDEVKNADFCVFDDIGQESIIEQSRDEILFPILNERMLNQKMTCFTSNYDFKSLQKHFEVNIYNDIDEMKALRIMERIRALSVEVQMDGKSRR